MNTHHRTSAEIEREVEHTREHITDTLRALRARMSPGQMLDEAIAYARDSSGGEMVQNLGRSLRDNPAPLILIGAGIAWMVAGGGAARANGHRRVSDGADGAASQMAHDAAARLSEGAGSLGDTLGAAADSARRGMHDARDGAADIARGLYHAGDSAYRATRDMGGAVSGLFREQPLVMGALGLALGAALGGIIPESETEDRLMGGTRDALMNKATDAAAEQYEKARAVVEKTADRIGREADRQGLTAEGAAEAVGEKTKAVFDAAKETAAKEAERQGLGDGGMPGMKADKAKGARNAEGKAAG